MLTVSERDNIIELFVGAIGVVGVALFIMMTSLLFEFSGFGFQIRRAPINAALYLGGGEYLELRLAGLPVETVDVPLVGGTINVVVDPVAGDKTMISVEGFWRTRKAKNVTIFVGTEAEKQAWFSSISEARARASAKIKEKLQTKAVPPPRVNWQPFRLFDL